MDEILHRIYFFARKVKAMAAEFNRVGESLVVAPVGEIDHHETKTMRDEIDEEILSTLPKKVIFDLSRTSFMDSFMDSSGLGLILGRYNKAESIGAEFEIANPGEKIMKIINNTNSGAGVTFH